MKRSLGSKEEGAVMVPDDYTVHQRVCNGGRLGIQPQI